MKMRTRSTADKPALLAAPEQYDERVATVLVSARRVGAPPDRRRPRLRRAWARSRRG